MTCDKRCNSTDFNKMCRAMLDCNIVAVKSVQISSNNLPVYASSGKDSLQTADLLFTDTAFAEETLPNEVP